MPLERQGKRNHNIGGVRLDLSPKIVQKYCLGYVGDFKWWKSEDADARDGDR